MSCFLSFIIPCYNVEKYVGECLASVSAQTDPEWEAICVDDGSTDRTGAIINEFADRDSRFKVIHKINGGLSSARNAGLALAAGEWLFYLDADDITPEWTIKEFRKCVRECPVADVLKGSLVQYRDGGHCVWGRSPEKPVNHDISREITFGEFNAFFPQFAYRREVFGKMLFIGANWCEDRLFHANFLVRANIIAETKSDVYGYRLRKGSITHNVMDLKTFELYHETSAKVLKLLKESKKRVSRDVWRLLYNQYTEGAVDLLLTVVREKDRGAAWNFWFDSLGGIRYDRTIGRWSRLCVMLCCFTRSRMIGILLCRLPYLLKQYGLHR